MYSLGIDIGYSAVKTAVTGPEGGVAHGDPVLNMGVPDKLAEMGYPVIPFYDLPETDIFKQHPNMYWPFGQHILEAAKIVKQHSNLYAVFLTHHGCGPDTVVSHYFREIMGDKPYLNLEVDEHSSDVGVLTRVEAFVSSLEKVRPPQCRIGDVEASMAEDKPVNIRPAPCGSGEGEMLYLPNLYPYAQIAREILVDKGIEATVMPRTNAQSIGLGRQHTMTNEYFALTALMGDVLQTFGNRGEGRQAVLLPQNEGAEVDGQYSRFLRTKLDELGRQDVAVISPFIEDLPCMEAKDVESLFLGLLAGDLVMVAPPSQREAALESILDLIHSRELSLNTLADMAWAIQHINRIDEAQTVFKGKRIFVIGDPLVLFNDTLNDGTFKRLEASGHRIIYAPLSEYLQSAWHDHLKQPSASNKPLMARRLALMDESIKHLSECLKEQSPFASSSGNLAALGDRSLGYYSGAFGRYRAARILGRLPNVNGIITAMSMYENTGITLNILHKSFTQACSLPVLNLTFDGYRNENDRTKIESFIHYI